MLTKIFKITVRDPADTVPTITFVAHRRPVAVDIGDVNPLRTQVASDRRSEEGC